MGRANRGEAGRVVVVPRACERILARGIVAGTGDIGVECSVNLATSPGLTVLTEALDGRRARLLVFPGNLAIHLAPVTVCSREIFQCLK